MTHNNRKLSFLKTMLAMCLLLNTGMTAVHAEGADNTENTGEDTLEFYEEPALEETEDTPEAEEAEQGDEEIPALSEAVTSEEETPADGEEDPQETIIPETEYFTEEAVYINPIYEGLVSAEDLFAEEPEVSEESESTDELVGAANYYYSNFDEAAEGLRNAVLQHYTTVDLYYIFPESYKGDLVNSKLSKLAFSGMNDYYDALVIGYKVNTTYNYTGAGTIKGVLSYQLEYSTTKDQETEFETKVKEAVNELNIYDKSEYEKAKAIYTFICSTVKYDYEHLNDETYNLKYSAYAALINKTAVCHGYSSLFQKMASLAGLQSHFIIGEGNGGGKWEKHSWNAVSINGKYYLLDSTWDSNYDGRFDDYEWFLKGTDYFPDHKPDAAYGSEFSKTDYDRGSSGSTTPVSSLTVNPASDSLFVGDMMELQVTISPTNANDKRLLLNFEIQILIYL